jgi:hypothetical protein
MIPAKNNPSDTLKQEASSLNRRRKTIMEQIKKEPRQIIHHLFNHNSPYLDGHSELHSLAKCSVKKTKNSDKTCDQEPPNSKTFSECKNRSASLGCLEPCDERAIDETFLEDFWDIISPEEFGDIVRRVFEQT